MVHFNVTFELRTPNWGYGPLQCDIWTKDSELRIVSKFWDYSYIGWWPILLHKLVRKPFPVDLSWFICWVCDWIDDKLFWWQILLYKLVRKTFFVVVVILQDNIHSCESDNYILVVIFGPTLICMSRMIIIFLVIFGPTLIYMSQTILSS